MATKETKVETTVETKPKQKYIITLPYIPGGPDSEIFGFNGVLTQIKCGEPVEVSKDIYDIYMERENFRRMANKHIEELEKEKPLAEKLL